MFNSNLCSATSQHGKECMAQAVEGAPIALCMRHIMEVGSFWNDVRPKRRDSKPKFTEAQAGRKSIGYGQDDGPVIYYILHGNRIKIGTSRNWTNRLKQLPCDRLLALEPGSTGIEAQRHKKFAHIRFDGSEWFADDDALWDHIVNVTEAHPDLTERVEAYNKHRAQISRARRADGLRQSP